MMRHRLDLRMQHRVIDKSPDTMGGGGCDEGFCKWQLVRTHIGADVIDRARSANGLRPCARIIHLADLDVMNADRIQSSVMGGASHKGTNGRAARNERLEHRLARLAASAGNQDHAWHPDFALSLRIPGEFEQPARAEWNLQQLDAAALQIERVLDGLRKQWPGRN